MTQKKVLVGMSGGVDSAAAAALLLERGYAVTGCLLRLHLGPEDPLWARNLADAQAVAEKGTLGILTGGITAAAGGITAAVLFGLLGALLFKSRPKS